MSEQTEAVESIRRMFNELTKRYEQSSLKCFDLERELAMEKRLWWVKSIAFIVAGVSIGLLIAP